MAVSPSFNKPSPASPHFGRLVTEAEFTALKRVIATQVDQPQRTTILNAMTPRLTRTISFPAWDSGSPLKIITSTVHWIGELVHDFVSNRLERHYSRPVLPEKPVLINHLAFDPSVLKAEEILKGLKPRPEIAAAFIPKDTNEVIFVLNDPMRKPVAKPA